MFTLKEDMLKAGVMEVLLYGEFSARSTSLCCTQRTPSSSFGSLGSEADNALNTACCTPRPSRRKNEGESRQQSVNSLSLLQRPYTRKTLCE